MLGLGGQGDTALSEQVEKEKKVYIVWWQTEAFSEEWHSHGCAVDRRSNA